MKPKDNVITLKLPNLKGGILHNFITILFVSALSLCSFVQAKGFRASCERCIIVFSLGDKMIEKLKQEMGEEDFYVMADDINHDRYSVSNYVEANNIEFIYIKDSDIFDTLLFANQKIHIESYFGYWIYKKGKIAKYFPDISEDEINKYFNISNPKYPKRE